MSTLIEPRTLRGFRDYLPALMVPREHLLDIARRVYRSYGFVPIDTPALEYAEVLLGKGGAETDRQVYRFQHDRHDVALRYDLTVPFARFAAQYIGQLGTPFKRYAMGPVWRGEAPQKGRYREFWQCDFDIIGTTSNASDIEVALVINDLFAAIGAAFGLGTFEVRINNRCVLNGLLEELGLADRAADLLRVLDKLPKQGRDAVLDEMTRPVRPPAPADGAPPEVVEAYREQTAGQKFGAGATPAQAGRLLDLAETTGTNDEVLARVEREFGGNARTAEGIARLRELLTVARAAGVPDGRFRIDLGIARGLDYYTGTIYETFLLDLPEKLAGVGSVCSGGRYDNLAGLYTKQHLPGVGASLGLDRLLAVMEELKLLPPTAATAPVLVVQFDAEYLGAYQGAARRLRAAGIGVEVYPDAKKVGAQLGYAEKRGFRLALIAGSDEVERNVWKVKDLARREEKTVTDLALVPAVSRMLGLAPLRDLATLTIAELRKLAQEEGIEGRSKLKKKADFIAALNGVGSPPAPAAVQ